MNGLTFPDGASDQQLLSPGDQSYVDHFWVSIFLVLVYISTIPMTVCCHYLINVVIRIYVQADKGDQTGFDILLEKHLNGKNAMKEMADFFRER